MPTDPLSPVANELPEIPVQPAPAVPPIQSTPLPLSGSFAHQSQAPVVPGSSPETSTPLMQSAPPPPEPPAQPMVITSPPPPAGSKTGMYLAMLVLFILGISLGYTVHQFLPTQTGSVPTPPATSKEEAKIIPSRTATPTLQATDSAQLTPAEETEEASDGAAMNVSPSPTL